ncbi:hypothetical protein GGS24DRAFT_486698 [Hypoxylon argillaceum]|nr:hypothetical protein GGS24DRAFT_486698 [Hypoxylon argillaceum]
MPALVNSSDEEESEYRFLVDDKHVKYITVVPGVFPNDDRTFAPNEGHISKNPLTQHPVFSLLWRMPFFEVETTAYEWIMGKGIGPRFLSHSTETGRVFGFVIENVDGARTAEPQDLAACQRILAKLHALEIKHGNINKHNFLIKNGEAVLMDIEMA